MADPKALELTEDNFEQEVISADTPVLVDFWATWCQPCRAIAPIVDELASEYVGKAKIGKVDTDAHGKLASRYDIRSIPTLLLFENGQVIHKFVGVRPKQEFTEQLDKALV